MNVSFDIAQLDMEHFEAQVEAAIRNVGRGAKAATIAACQEIILESRIQVPKDTWTLGQSAFFEVQRRADVIGYSYEGIIGYGGNGDPVNPRTGKSASEYMLKVHEDLSAQHTNGKAKFLEDPARDYAEGRFIPTVLEFVALELVGMSGK